MEKKVVLITGGSSGIGRTTGIFLKKKGYTVYGTTRNLAKNPDFTDFNLLELDVTATASIEAAVTKLIEAEGRLDVLINNAGVGITGPIEETPIAEVHKTFDTNYYGPLRMLQVVLPHMRKQGAGLIINITSIAGYMGLPYRGIYSASKAALEITTEALRMETKAFGVTITNLAPGDFATNIAAGRYHAPVSGQSAYHSYEKTLKMINDDVDAAEDPIKVAEKIVVILEAKKPRVHYKVGTFMQKFSVVLKKFLPDKVYERLLLNHYKL